jgi:DNA-binding transcriptional MerR regulator
MGAKRSYLVSQVAELSGVSVRTLHHYDAIGLLVPSMRSTAGYRLYSDDDLLRLQQVLIGRALGWSLEAIASSLDDPEFDRRRALLEQRALLERRAADTAAMLRSVDAALQALAEEGAVEGAEALRDSGATTARESKDEKEWTVDMKKLFDGFDPDEHAEEARERWGHTEAYRVSQQRARRYKEADWLAIRDEAAEVYAAAAAALNAGRKPDEPEAMDAAERHRLHIDRWFYPCSAAMHCGLADLYEADPRFAKSIDQHGEGLAPFLSAAIRANAKRVGTGGRSGQKETT